MSDYIQFPNGKRITGIAARITALSFLSLIFFAGLALGALVS